MLCVMLKVIFGFEFGVKVICLEGDDVVNVMIVGVWV